MDYIQSLNDYHMVIYIVCFVCSIVILIFLTGNSPLSVSPLALWGVSLDVVTHWTPC